MKLHIKNCQPQRIFRSPYFQFFALLSVVLLTYGNVQAQYYYYEDFMDQADGATSEGGNTPWSVTYTGAGEMVIDDEDNAIEARALDGAGQWYSDVVSIPGSATITVEISELDDAEDSDYIDIYLSLDGGTYVFWTGYQNDFTNQVLTTTVSASTVQVGIQIVNNVERHQINRVVIESTSSSSTLYSIADGDWDAGSTWSTTGYGGASCGCYPGETSSVFVGNGRTINMNVDGQVNNMTIENTGTIQFTADDVELNMENDGVFTINNGGAFLENGFARADLDFQSGTGTGQLVVNSGANFDIGRLYFFSASTVDISGAGDINLSDNIYFRNAVTVNNNSTGTMYVGGNIYYDADNVSFTNSGTIYITGDFLFASDDLSVYTGNSFTTTSGSRIDIAGDIDLLNGDLTINNRGVINQYGNFVLIDTGSDFNNLGGGTWAWYYVGTYDTDINTVLSAAGLFEYEGFGDQLVIPIPYNNVTIDGSGIKQLQANTNIKGVLYMTASYISLGDYDLTIGNTGKVGNGNSNAFIITDGAGSLIQNNIGSTGRTGDISFPIGLSSTSYTPLTINNSGTADQFSARICSGIFEEGTCGSGTSSTAETVNQTWFIEEATAGGSNATVNFQWNASNESAGFDRSNINVIHHNGSMWEAIASGAASGSGPYTISATGVTSFSPFGIEGADSPLPVELMSFEAELKLDKVEITWATASELNNDYFTIEKSRDLEHFEAVKTVHGQGTSDQLNEYLTYDHEPYSGVSYYRLKQTDFDGSVSYSKLVRIEYDQDNELDMVVYPVPSDGNAINLVLAGVSNSDNISIQISDMQGRLVYQSRLQSNEHNYIRFNNKLAPGMYIINLNTPQPTIKYFIVK